MVGAAAIAGRTRRVPTRSCVACRTPRAKRDLLRVVRAPDGAVLVDAGGRSAGRGAYVCASEACVTRAVKTGALGRALERRLPPDVQDLLVAAITGSSEPNEHDDDEGGTRGQE